jgi:hypothetical protein
MRRREGRFVALAVLVCVVVLSGCERTRIADINNDPGRYMGKDITVVGEVVNSVGAFNQGAFELDDRTGRLWVLSTGFGVPRNGARIAVTGRIQGGVTIGNRSIANVLRETKARHGG